MRPSRPIRRSVLLFLFAGLLTVPWHGCGRPPTSEVTPGTTVTTSDASDAPVLGPDGLRTLEAPLELTWDPEAERMEVTRLGPPGPVLLFSSAMRGYVEPCGCTLDVLLGGIDRVSGFVRAQKALDPRAAMIDAGNMLFEAEQLGEGDVPQAVLKAELLLAGHRAMGTLSTTPGRLDFSLGADKYRELVDKYEVPVTVANLTQKDQGTFGEPWRILTLSAEGEDTVRIGVVGVVDPETVEAIYDLEPSDPADAVANAVAAIEAAETPIDVLVIVAQGDLAFARDMARAAPSADFVLVGRDAAKTDEVVTEGNTAILQAYSQGRHLGVLKLYPGAGDWVNARLGTEEEVERLDRRIAYIDEALSQVPPASASNESPFVTKKRAELDALLLERLQVSSGGVELPADGAGFAYFSVPMKPGYPLDLAMHQRLEAYTLGLEDLYAQLAPTVPEPAEGQAGFIGSEACVDCHEESHDFWQETPHSHALQTLVDRGKAHDPDCLSCHVVGYDQPGGSIVGNIGILADVGCESCHGPGSLHALDTSLVDTEGGVWLQVGAEICLGCHDPENSPRFDYDRYVPEILGEGHDKKGN